MHSTSTAIQGRTKVAKTKKPKMKPGEMMDMDGEDKAKKMTVAKKKAMPFAGGGKKMAAKKMPAKKAAKKKK